MPDLIDRNRLLKYIDNMGIKDCISNPVIETANTMQSLFKQVVEAMPKTDTERHAHWKKFIAGNDTSILVWHECSNCGERATNIKLTNYCDNCGCKMDEVCE